MGEPVQPTFLLVLGFPGVGKLTSSKALISLLEARGETACLVDSHLMVDPILKVVGADGIHKLDPEVFNYATMVRTAVMGALEHHGIPDCHYVFTLFATDVEQAKADELLIELSRIASVRGAGLKIVRLVCELDELLRRATTEERARRPKLVNPRAITAIHEQLQVYTPSELPSSTIDVTALSASDVAELLLAEVLARSA